MPAIRTAKGGGCFRGWRRSARIAQVGWRGFVQYGHSAIGFDESGAVTDGVSYPIIRQLYFASGDEEIGRCLLDGARAALACENGRVYAFFHYFGLSCYARHGKLFKAAITFTGCCWKRAFRSSMKTCIIPPR